jgi:hypothetical protein
VTAAAVGLGASLAAAPPTGEHDPTGTGTTVFTITEIGPGGTTISVSQR